ncbi:hypothetical protein CesoFtcFv8_017180 [Champsocephalus esox]|uniref:CEP170 C-terminal domain-containing protein n=1 Tax=Champsocephalus esox TaxID=159716 RepID=A0AAN8BJS1_9TELE|nr:hypothetical protein CesoFtcFv8_017180 [Champsocephalus esox]
MVGMCSLTLRAHAHVYILERSQHKVPEEALKHEKYTSQLQLGIKALQAKAKEKQQLQSSEKSKSSLSKLQDKVERKAQSLTASTESPISKPTPLYGQPSWWGEDEEAASKSKNRGGKSPEQESPEPAKDVSRYEHKLSSTEHVTAPTEVISAESKVADWLVQSNDSMRRKSIAEELYGTNGYSSPLRITKANHSEDDTHVESRDPAINGGDFLQSDPLSVSHVSPQPLRASPPQRLASPDSEEALSRSPPEPQSLSSLGKAEPHQTFVIEFFNEGPRKKRSQSFTNNPSPPESSCLRVPLDKVKKSSSPAVERRGPPPASTTTPTKRYTVPLKGPASTGFQRAGSLRREKTEDRMSTSYSTRSSSSVSARPFSSVGRRSKLAQEFNAESLKQAKPASSASWEENASSPPTAAKTETVAISQSSPAPSKAPYQPQTSSPIHQPVALKAPVMALVTQSVEVTSPTVGPKHEEEDSLSDAGTYTIEADIQDKELEEARTKIDQVFGVLQSPERTNQTEADSSSEFSPVLVESREQHRQSSCGEVQAVLQGAPKWMSCWASLADSYTESGPSSGLFDISSQMELSAGARGSITNNATLTIHNDSADSNGSRARRILPQVPKGEKSDIPTPSIHVHYDPHSTFIVGERGLATPRFQEGLHRLSVQDDVEPDSLSDASRSDDGSIVEQKRRQPSDTEEKTKENKLSTKSTSFYIGSEESQPHRGSSNSSTEKRNGTKMFSTATLTKPKGSPDSGKIKPTLSAPVLNQSSDSEGSVSPLIRQESYTKERPSNARLPNISILSLQRESESFQGAVNQDTHSYLKDTEDVLAALEAKLRAGQSEKNLSPVMDCVSTESDVDTSSTVSQHSNNTRLNILTSKASASGLHRERSSGSIASQDSSYQSTTSEKMRSLEADGNNQTGFFRRPVGLRRSVGKHGSTDLSDDPQSLPYSDHESNSYQTRKKYTVPLQKEDSKTTRTSMALSRANSLTAPRPTRASMLRRARLGEASDNEGTETDRMSQEAGNAPAKQPQDTKKLSRLDLLAMPRKRAGSFNTPSDTESSSAPIRSGFSNRSTESGDSSARRASTSGLKPAEKQQRAPPNKVPLTRGRSSSAKYTGSTTSSRRRQKGSDYASTSDEEYDSNQSTPKHKRSQPSSASHSPRHQARPQPVVVLRPKPRSRDSEDENNEGEAYNNWTNHSSEIARLSQDLAKDLAILAREIHDVAGDGDPTNPAEQISAPVSTVTAHEQLVHRIPEAGLNHQRVPPNSAPPREPEQSCSDPEVSSRPRARSRDEVTVDNLMLNPVSQITMAIRENTEQLAGKIKLLFQDRLDIWEEIDAKANSDNDVPVVKSANKEITSILKELRRVQRQLEVINTVMEPSGQLEASKASASSSSSSGVQPSRPPASRDWRTVHSASRRGGGPRPSESVRRAAVTPDDVRAGYLV